MLNNQKGFDPNKVSTIIKIAREFLKDRERYRIYCEFTVTELVELRKHFDVTVDEFDNRIHELKLK